MTYRSLPSHPTLPELPFLETAAKSSRYGAPIERVWVHRWGGGSLPGVETEFEQVKNQASAHVVYAGEVGPHAGEAVQMVRFAEKAWTEGDFNRTGVSIESADAIWLGHDPAGFARLARMVAYLCHANELGSRWVRGAALVHGGRGFCRHADGGQAAGGHTSCPTTDIALWQQFAWVVRRELRRGEFRPSWGR